MRWIYGCWGGAALACALLWSAPAKAQYKEGYNPRLAPGGRVQTPPLETSPLIMAIQENDLVTVRNLLDRKADPDTKSVDGTPALGVAVLREQENMVALLLAHGAHVNATDAQQQTALMAAVERSNLELVKTLLAKGANINAKDVQNKTALFLAVNSTQLSNVPMPSSVQDTQRAIVRFLLAHGADVNILTKPQPPANPAIWVDVEVYTISNGRRIFTSLQLSTPLAATALSGNIEIAKLLLAHGADVNLHRPEWPTTLTFAARNGQTEMVKLLLAHHADVNARDTNGGTALQEAAGWGYVEIARQLLDAGANQETSNAALRKAAANGQTEIVRYLLFRHADVNAPDVRGSTALILAAANGHAEVVRLLLSHGAAVDAHDQDGKSALWYAGMSKSAEIGALLKQAGATD